MGFIKCKSTNINRNIWATGMIVYQMLKYGWGVAKSKQNTQVYTKIHKA